MKHRRQSKRKRRKAAIIRCKRTMALFPNTLLSLVALTELKELTGPRESHHKYRWFHKDPRPASR